MSHAKVTIEQPATGSRFETVTGDSGEYHEVARRHAGYYRAFFADSEAESEVRPQAEWLAIYGRHIDNVRASLDWAFAPDGLAATR